jgi:hypothetical protein
MKVYLTVINKNGTKTFEKAYDGEEAKNEAIKVLTEYASYKTGFITNIARTTFRRNDLAGHQLNITIKYTIGTTYYYKITD